MIFFNQSEKVVFLATQCMNYDRYACRTYALERVDVNGKFGLVCVEQSDEYGIHAKVLLPPVYNDIEIKKISSQRAIYDRYMVFANGEKIAQFTLGLNAWVPMPYFHKN
jgi:hypothetical protein